jgi:hypothetical protein
VSDLPQPLTLGYRPEPGWRDRKVVWVPHTQITDLDGTVHEIGHYRPAEEGEEDERPG